MCNLGPEKFLEDKDLLYMMRLLPTFQHPHLMPVVFAQSSETSGIAVRFFHEKGTLRDLICKAKPQMHYMKKYCGPKERIGLHMPDIKLFGRQILEVLQYLHDKGLYYGHLHAGNVIIDGKRAHLLDIENCMLGLPSVYRPYFTSFKKIQTLEAVDVYCFGQLLYEMAFGEQLFLATCNSFHPQCSPTLRSVLESILTSEACKNGLPSFKDLLSHPFFSEPVPLLGDKPQVKIPSKLKELVQSAKSQMEHRLREEQKVIHQYQRLSKAKAFHMSEEEKKKRRKSKKKEKTQVHVLDENGTRMYNGSPAAIHDHEDSILPDGSSVSYVTESTPDNAS